MWKAGTAAALFTCGCYDAIKPTVVEQDGPDALLEENTLYDNLYEQWDIDLDRYLAWTEVRQGLERADWLGRWDTDGTFYDWDLDNDRVLTPTEFERALGRVHTTWDTDDDGRLTGEELGQAVFDAWDTDDDGRIDVYKARWGYSSIRRTS